LVETETEVECGWNITVKFSSLRYTAPYSLMGASMKKLLLASITSVAVNAGGSASAADMPVKTPPPPQAWSWSGFYIGVQGGAGWGITEDNLTSLGGCLVEFGVCNEVPLLPGLFRDSYPISGWHGGGTVGWNWQIGPIVFGVEGDISGANIKGDSSCTEGVGRIPLSSASSCSTNMTWFATATGRLGFAIDRALLYVKAGGAWAHFDRNLNSGTTISLPGVAFPTPKVGENRSGFTFGAGIEYAFWGNWSAKLEYDYMDFGTRSYEFVTFNPITTITTFSRFDDRERVHVIRAGLNYRFGWIGKGPVVASY
jgi:outer membrane immunogenic protein